jgi:hypothetical protein
MLELYLVVSLMGSSPSVQSYKDVQDACQAVEQLPDDRVKLYKETIDRRETVELKEGSCKPIKQFFQAK